MSETFDHPDVDEVLQQDEPNISSVPVTVENIVRTEELPTRTYYRNTIILTGGNAVKVLNANPLRKNFVVWIFALGAGVEAVCIGGKEGDVTNFVGAMLMSVNAITRYEFTDRGEVWMRGAVINDTTGTFTGYGISTDDAVVSIVSEHWAN